MTNQIVSGRDLSGLYVHMGTFGFMFKAYVHDCYGNQVSADLRATVVSLEGWADGIQYPN